MNTGSGTTVTGRSAAAHPGPWLVIALLMLANLPLWDGRPPASLVFLPGRVAAGEWWRMLTCPLAHVSWYHLLLDGAAFLPLFMCLGEFGFARRLLVVLGAHAGSLLLPLAVPSPIREVGLCGLSGVDHGLMAAAAALMLGEQDRSARRLGGCLLAAVVLKAAAEALTGDILFASSHLGSLGVPVAASHLGGVLGALAVPGVLPAVRGRAPRVPGGAPRRLTPAGTPGPPG